MGESLTGYLLFLFLPLIREYPYVLALYPVLAAARGNIYSSLASRITSQLHLGVVEGKPASIYAKEVERVLVLSVISASYSATIAYLAVVLGLGDGRIENPLLVYTTALLTPLLMAPIMTGVAVVLALLGYRRGVDPDEYLSPILTVIVDIITLPILVLTAILSSRTALLVLLPILIAAFVYLTLLDERDRRIIRENLAFIIAGSSLEFLRSYALMATLPFLEKHPLVLTLMPVFNAENGAAIAALASRYSTLLHIGLALPPLVSEITETLVILQPPYLLSTLLISSAIAPQLLVEGYMLLLIASLILLPVLVALTRVLGPLLYEKGLDPDNTLIPLMTTLTDIAGTLTLLSVSTAIFEL